MTAVGGLDHVITASDPLNDTRTRRRVQGRHDRQRHRVLRRRPGLARRRYLDDLDDAVEPAPSAGLEVEYGGGAGQIGQATDDRTSELIGLGLALLLLLLMFGSIARGRRSRWWRRSSASAPGSPCSACSPPPHLPTTAPTVATLLGLGVAIDYGLFLVARHREQLDDGMDCGQSLGRHGARRPASAIVVAGSTVVVAILGLYVSGVPFVGALGTAVGDRRRGHDALRAHPGAGAPRPRRVAACCPRGPARRRAEPDADHDVVAAELGPPRDAASAHEHSAFARWGRQVSDRPWPWAIAAMVCSSCSRSRCSRSGSASSTPAPTRQSDSSRRGVRPDRRGFRARRQRAAHRRRRRAGGAARRPRRC